MTNTFLSLSSVSRFCTQIWNFVLVCLKFKNKFPAFKEMEFGDLAADEERRHTKIVFWETRKFLAKSVNRCLNSRLGKLPLFSKLLISVGFSEKRKWNDCLSDTESETLPSAWKKVLGALLAFLFPGCSGFVGEHVRRLQTEGKSVTWWNVYDVQNDKVFICRWKFLFDLETESRDFSNASAFTWLRRTLFSRNDKYSQNGRKTRNGNFK